jgi:hypothetical protein
VLPFYFITKNNCNKTDASFFVRFIVREKYDRKATRPVISLHLYVKFSSLNEFKKVGHRN